MLFEWNTLKCILICSNQRLKKAKEIFLVVEELSNNTLVSLNDKKVMKDLHYMREENYYLNTVMLSRSRWDTQNTHILTSPLCGSRHYYLVDHRRF